MLLAIGLTKTHQKLVLETYAVARGGLTRTHERIHFVLKVDLHVSLAALVINSSYPV